MHLIYICISPGPHGVDESRDWPEKISIPLDMSDVIIKLWVSIIRIDYFPLWSKWPIESAVTRWDWRLGMARIKRLRCERTAYLPPHTKSFAEYNLASPHSTPRS